MSYSAKELRVFVEKIAKQVLQDESNKTVVDGIITESCAGYYKVHLSKGSEASEVTATSLYTEKSFNKDDHVYLVEAAINTGDEQSSNYFVVGLVEAVDTQFFNMSEIERFMGYGAAINAEVDEESAEISSSHLAVSSAYEENVPFINALRTTGVMKFTANVSSNVATRKDFGFKFSFFYEDTTEEERIFNHESFVGQPWSMNHVTQTKILTFEKENKIIGFSVDVFPDSLEEGETFTVHSMSLECGTLINVAQDFTVSIVNVTGKTYFNKGNDTSAVQLKATVNYGSQKLDTKYLKYYWFVEDESVKEDSTIEDGYSVLGGMHWRLLNDWEYAKVIDGDKEIDDERFVLYENTSNTIDIYKSTTSQYENKIKCVVTYQLAQAESEPLIIYDFDHEEYDAVLELSNGRSPLLTNNDFVKVEVKLTSKLILPKDLQLTYQWWVNGVLLEEGSNSSILTIYGGEGDRDQNEFHYNVADKVNRVTCNVLADGLNIAETLEIIIESYASLQSQLESQYLYKYWVDTSSMVVFEKNDDGLWQRADTEDTGLDEIEIDNLDLDESKNYFVYRSVKECILDAADSIITEYDWTQPKIINKYKHNGSGWITAYSDAEVEQLNIFNTLTNNGSSQGVYYTDGEKELYINANYIRTGAIQVGEGEDELFYASIHSENPEVKIGGYKVSKTALQSSDGKVGMSSSGEEYAFWAGRSLLTGIPRFAVNHDGSIITRDLATKSELIFGAKGTTGYIRADNMNMLVIDGLGFESGDDRFFRAVEDFSNEAIQYYYKYQDPGDPRSYWYLPIVSVADFLNENPEETIYVFNKETYPTSTKKAHLVIDTENFILDRDGSFCAKNAIITGELKSLNYNEEEKEETFTIPFQEDAGPEGRGPNGFHEPQTNAERKYGYGEIYEETEYGYYTGYSNVYLNGYNKDNHYFGGIANPPEYAMDLSWDDTFKEVPAGSSVKLDGDYKIFLTGVFDFSLPYDSEITLPENAWGEICDEHGFPITDEYHTYVGQDITDCFDLEWVGAEEGMRRLVLKQKKGFNFYASYQETKIINPHRLLIEANYDPSFTASWVVKTGASMNFKGDSPGINFPSFLVDKYGNITATAGSVAGFHITGTHLSDGNRDDYKAGHKVMISPGWKSGSSDIIKNGEAYCFWAGEAKSFSGSIPVDSTRPFWVKTDGTIHATKGTIGCLSLKNDSQKGDYLEVYGDGKSIPFGRIILEVQKYQGLISEHASLNNWYFSDHTFDWNGSTGSVSSQKCFWTNINGTTVGANTAKGQLVFDQQGIKFMIDKTFLDWGQGENEYEPDFSHFKTGLIRWDKLFAFIARNHRELLEEI